MKGVESKYCETIDSKIPVIHIPFTTATVEHLLNIIKSADCFVKEMVLCCHCVSGEARR